MLPGSCEKVIVPALSQTSCDLCFRLPCREQQRRNMAAGGRERRASEKQRKRQGWGGEVLFMAYSANTLHCVKPDSSHKQFIILIDMMPSSVAKPLQILHSCVSQRDKFARKSTSIKGAIDFFVPLLYKITSN